MSRRHQFGDALTGNGARHYPDAAMTGRRGRHFLRRCIAQDGQIVGRFRAQASPHLVYSGPLKARQQSDGCTEQPAYATGGEVLFKTDLFFSGTDNNCSVIFGGR